MPFYKYVANRMLTLAQNLMLGAKLSEYHTGYRAFSSQVLATLPLLANSDDFVFDNEMLTQAVAFGFRIGEVSCPTKYFTEASSISFRRSAVYGLGVLKTSVAYRLWKWGLVKARLFTRSPTATLRANYYGAPSDDVEINRESQPGDKTGPSFPPQETRTIHPAGTPGGSDTVTIAV